LNKLAERPDSVPTLGLVFGQRGGLFGYTRSHDDLLFDYVSAHAGEVVPGLKAIGQAADS